jgi:hypothetical protein
MGAQQEPAEQGDELVLLVRPEHVDELLAQQLLLAHLAISEGRTAAGSAIAEKVRRWSGAIGLSLCQQQADALLAGGRA